MAIEDDIFAAPKKSAHEIGQPLDALPFTNWRSASNCCARRSPGSEASKDSKGRVGGQPPPFLKSWSHHVNAALGLS